MQMNIILYESIFLNKPLNTGKPLLLLIIDNGIHEHSFLVNNTF